MNVEQIMIILIWFIAFYIVYQIVNLIYGIENKETPNENRIFFAIKKMFNKEYRKLDKEIEEKVKKQYKNVEIAIDEKKMDIINDEQYQIQRKELYNEFNQIVKNAGKMFWDIAEIHKLITKKLNDCSQIDEKLIKLNSEYNIHTNEISFEEIATNEFYNFYEVMTCALCTEKYCLKNQMVKDVDLEYTKIDENHEVQVIPVLNLYQWKCKITGKKSVKMEIYPEYKCCPYCGKKTQGILLDYVETKDIKSDEEILEIMGKEADKEEKSRIPKYNQFDAIFKERLNQNGRKMKDELLEESISIEQREEILEIYFDEKEKYLSLNEQLTDAIDWGCPVMTDKIQKLIIKNQLELLEELEMEYPNENPENPQIEKLMGKLRKIRDVNED